MDLNQLFQAEWDFRMQADPLAATRFGDHRYNDRLPSVSVGDYQRRLAQARLFMDELSHLEGSISPAEHLNYALFKHTLKLQIADLEFGAYYLPVTKNSGLHVDFPDLQDITPFNTSKDYQDYTARLNGFMGYALAHIDLMRQGLTRGYIPPLAALAGIQDACRMQITADPALSLFCKPFLGFPKSIPDADQPALYAAGLAAIRDSVIPGYRALLDFFEAEYLPAAPVQVSAAQLPNGPAYYQHLIYKFTSLDLTPRQIHATGLDEVRRIRLEMEALIRSLQFEGDLGQFIQTLRSEPRFYVDTPQVLLSQAALIAKRMDGELPRLFTRLPRTPYGIRPIPDYLSPTTSSAYYSLPAGDGTTAGFYCVNTYDLKSRPLYEFEALTFHEAVPGHHLQLALQMELENLPAFRRFSDMTAFIEGWALYAERLGLEVGFYTDPYSNFGRLIFEMWRACRLVVDTGLHALGWTRQQAIDYMAENTALSLLNITNEVDRYIGWPGQALAYKLGELKIRQLRQYAETELGLRFDLRLFHDMLLKNGSLPLDVLEEIVKNWVETCRGPIAQ